MERANILMKFSEELSGNVLKLMGSHKAKGIDNKIVHECLYAVNRVLESLNECKDVMM